MGIDESGIGLDELITHLVGAVAQHPVDENVAQVLYMLHRLGDVDTQLCMTVDTVASQVGAAMIVLGYLDQGLGGHAPDTGAGGAGLAAVDQDEAFSAWAHLAGGIESRCTGTKDGDIDFLLSHGFLPPLIIVCISWQILAGRKQECSNLGKPYPHVIRTSGATECPLCDMVRVLEIIGGINHENVVSFTVVTCSGAGATTRPRTGNGSATILRPNQEANAADA